MKFYNRKFLHAELCVLVMIENDGVKFKENVYVVIMIICILFLFSVCCLLSECFIYHVPYFQVKFTIDTYKYKMNTIV